MADAAINEITAAVHTTSVPSSTMAAMPAVAPTAMGHVSTLVVPVDGTYANLGSGVPALPTPTSVLATAGAQSQSERSMAAPAAQAGSHLGSSNIDSTGAGARAGTEAGITSGGSAVASGPSASGTPSTGAGANGASHAATTAGKGEAGGSSSGGTGSTGASNSGPNGVVSSSSGGGTKSGSSLGKRSGSQSQSKPQSAWMLFIQDRREQVKLDNPDIAVTQQQKIMSEIWKTMSGDEREAYRSRARDDQKRYKLEQADKPPVKKEDALGSSEGGTSTELVCPLGRIGRIIKLDQDVQSVTKEATALIGKAMELFTALVAKEAFSVSQSQNRRLLKLQDITDIMHNQDQFYWIKDDFPLPPR